MSDEEDVYVDDDEEEDDEWEEDDNAIAEGGFHLTEEGSRLFFGALNEIRTAVRDAVVEQETDNETNHI